MATKRRRPTDAQYRQVLQRYGQRAPKTRRYLREKTEKVLTTKLCRCIKKVGVKMGEPRAIGICTKTVFGKKGFRRGAFKCRGTRRRAQTYTK